MERDVEYYRSEITAANHLLRDRTLSRQEVKKIKAAAKIAKQRLWQLERNVPYKQKQKKRVMGWEQEVKNRIKTGGVYSISGIGKVRVTGNIRQYGGAGSGGGLFVKCEIVESKNNKYEVGSVHSLNAEFMH